MDSFELNKIAGALLGTLTVLLGINAISKGLFHAEKPEKPGYAIEAKTEGAGGKEGGGAAAGGAAAGGGDDFGVILASADPAKGEAVSKKCAACHSFGKGQPAKIGPNLYGIIGLKHAHMEGFGYSAAMKATSDKVWDFDNINHWLENPKGYISGTSMSFAGIKAPEERANLIAYLNKNSDSPQPLPKAGEGAGKPAAGGDKQAAAGGGEAPAAGAAAGGGDVLTKVASADPKKGEAVSKKCAACHSFGKGEPAKVGPNLYGIVGLPHAHMEGFGYSAAMKASHDKTWDVATLDKWLENPKGYIAGTSMGFAGVKSPDDRAALIAYLNKNSDKPQELGGGAAAPAGGEKKTEAAPAAPADAKKPDAASAGDKPAPAAAPAEGEKKTEAAPAPAGPPAEAEKKAEAAPAPAAGGGGGGGVVTLLASADVAKGETIVTEQCAVCHTFKKGEPAGVGPNLYGVVGLKHGHMEGFEYSDAFKSHPGTWDFANLDEWLTDPDKYAPGTAMSYPGLPEAADRANVIAWLNKNSDSPQPIPAQ